MKVTETFELTYDVFNDMLTEEEFQAKLSVHKEQDLPGEPSRRRFPQIISVGGTRSSKTYSILQILYLEMMSRIDIDIKVWRDTKVSCKKICMKDFRSIVRSDMSRFNNFKENKTEGSYTYVPTGSKITFEGADNIGVVLGAGQHISFFNEVNHITEEVYKQVKQRTEEMIISDYNPAAKFYLEKYRNDPETKFIHSTFMNNAFCAPNSVITILESEPWERGSYEIVGAEIHYKNNPISDTNQPPVHQLNLKKGTIDKYHWLVYGLGIGAEKPNRIYKGWKVISLEDFKQLPYVSYFGLDFGTSSPTACTEVKYDGNGVFYIRGAMYKPMGEIDDSINTALLKYVPEIKKGTSLIVGDSAKKEYLNTVRRGGHMIVGAIKGAGSVSPGIQDVKSFTIYYVPDNDLEEEYANYSWAVDREFRSTDEPVKKNDHYLDSIRYCITYLIRYLSIEV